MGPPAIVPTPIDVSDAVTGFLVVGLLADVALGLRGDDSTSERNNQGADGPSKDLLSLRGARACVAS